MVRICVFQNWGLGDLVMTTPVIAEIRRLHPDADITLIARGGPQVALMATSPAVNRVLAMPKNAERRKMLGFFLGLRRYRFDVAFIGTRITPASAAMLRFLAGVKTIIGDGKGPRWLYTHLGTIDRGVHRVDRMLATLSLWTGTPPAPAYFPVATTPEADAQAIACLDAHGLVPGRFLAIHPGSSLVGKERRIPIPTVEALIRQVRAGYPWCRVAILCGPEDFALVPPFTAFAATIEGVCVLTDLPLAVTNAVIGKAGCFVGSDSALGHIAAAFGTPVVTVFGPAIPTETRPYGDVGLVMRVEKLDCQPCWGTPAQGKCPIGMKCMTDIAVEAVVAPVAAALDKIGARADAAAPLRARH